VRSTDLFAQVTDEGVALDPALGSFMYATLSPRTTRATSGSVARGAGSPTSATATRRRATPRSSRCAS
jgi:hypothetical protein